MWPNCLGAVRKDSIRGPQLLVVGGRDRDIVVGGGGGAVLSTFYVLISTFWNGFQNLGIGHFSVCTEIERGVKTFFKNCKLPLC